LAQLRKITEEGVEFNSHVDGRKIFMSPEDSIRIQTNLGSDIAMALDECVEIPSPREYVKQSCDRTYRWLVRCKEETKRASGQGDGPPVLSPCPVPDLFGINQGATFEDLRISHMKSIAELDLPGYAIGGLAVGETTQQMYDVVDAVEEHMPSNKPRYLMGVGTPQNIIEAVARGIDFFDCVMPARNGRHGKLYTWSGNGHINILNQQYIEDSSPIDTECGCLVCQKYSRAYIRHLFKAGEMLAMRLAVMHNLYYYNKLLQKIRDALDGGTFEKLRSEINAIN
jgi:queuine tRNA-ribosyltransferase